MRCHTHRFFVYAEAEQHTQNINARCSNAELDFLPSPLATSQHSNHSVPDVGVHPVHVS
jgi:hypothetical protein